jgi:hypothetical protein
MYARRVDSPFVSGVKNLFGQLLLFGRIAAHNQFHYGFLNIKRFSYHSVLASPKPPFDLSKFNFFQYNIKLVCPLVRQQVSTDVQSARAFSYSAFSLLNAHFNMTPRIVIIKTR